MNEQALQDSYNLFKSKGYGKSFDDYKNLLRTNSNALNDSYALFKSGGYNKSIDDYKVLMGVGGTTPVVKKKDSTSKDMGLSSKPQGIESSSVTRSKKEQKPSGSSVSGKPKQEVFTGYPGKEEKRYKLDTSTGTPVWKEEIASETIVDGKKTLVFKDKTITNPSRVLALNNKFKTEASTGANEEIFTGYPGKEEKKYILDSSTSIPVWNEYIGNEKKQITDPARINALNIKFKQKASLDKFYEEFGSYDDTPEKKDNRYRIKDGTWERLVPGSKEYTTITNPGSINALNNRYEKNIVAPKEIVSKAKEIDPFLKINSKFLNQSEESAQQVLEKNYKGMGFTFEQTGMGSDYIRVIPSNGAEPQTFSFDEKSKGESIRLQSYLRTNASLEDESNLSSVYKIKKNIAKKEQSSFNKNTVYNIDHVIKNNDYYKSKEYKNNFNNLTYQQKRDEIKRRQIETVDQNVVPDWANYIGEAIFGEDKEYEAYKKELKKFENKLYNSEEYKLFNSEKKEFEAQQQKKYDKLYDELNIAKINKDKEAIKTAKLKIESGYSKDVIGDNVTNLTASQYDLKDRIATQKKRIENLKLNGGSLSQQEYNDEVENINSEGEKLNIASKNITINQKKINELTGVYVTEKAKSGGFFGNILNSFVVAVDEVRDPLSLIVPAVGRDLTGDEAIAQGIESRVITPEQREYYKEKKYTDEQIKNVRINQEKIKAITANKKAVIQAVGSDLTTEESKANLGFVENALVGVAASLPSMLTRAIPVVGQVAAFGSMANMSYNAINEEMLMDSDFETTSEFDRAVVALPYSIVMGALENYGLNKMTKGQAGVLGKAVLSGVMKIVPKGATREVFENIANKEIKNIFAKGAIKVVGGALAEAETGALQTLIADIGIKGIYNIAKEKYASEEDLKNLTGGEAFDTPDSFTEGLAAVGEGALAEAIGGFAMSTFMVGAQGLINGKLSLYNEEDLKFFEDFASDEEFKKVIVSQLKTQMLNGTMTRKEAESTLNDISSVEGVFNSISDNISQSQKLAAFNLINEKNRLEREIAGKDENLVATQKARVVEINNELIKISEDATKEIEQPIQEVTAEGGVSEYKGAGEGQQEVGVGQGIQRDTTVDETNLGDSNIPGQVQEEITPQKVVIDKPIITTNTATEVQRVKSLTQDAEDGATLNLDGTKYEGVGLVVPVDSINTTIEELTPEMIADFVEERQEMIGDAGVVKAGIYKFPNSNQVSIDLNVVVPETSREQALEFGRLAGQESLFDLGTFENVKTGATGENPMKFTPEQHREIATALKEGRLPNVFGPTIEQEVEAIGQLLSGTDQEIDQKASTIIPNKRMSRIVTRAAKAVSRILPGVKFIVHSDNNSFVSATNEGQSQKIGGIFDPKTNTIHINLVNANARTVAHEVFHAILLNKVKTDANASATTKRMVQSIASKIDDNPELKKKLEDFISNYEENIQNEEKVAELVGMLSENYNSFSANIKDIIARWIDKLAKIFNLDPFNRNETYDMLNTIARKVSKGKVISEADVKIIEDVDNGESFESQYVSTNGTVVITPSNRKSKVAGTVVSESDLIDPNTLVGKPLEVVYYDNFTSSPYELKNRISGSTIKRVGEGGPGYSYRPEIKKARIIAAFTNVTKVLNSIQGIRSRNNIAKDNAVIGVALQNKETGHLGNKTTERDFYSPSEGVIAQAINDKLITENEAVVMLKGAVDAYASTSKGSDPKSSLGFTSNDFSTLDDFYKKIGAVSFERRGTFNAVAIPSKEDLKITKATKPYIIIWLNSGIPTLKEYFNATTEQYTKEAEAHDIVKYLDPELDKIGVDSSVNISEKEIERAKEMGVKIETISSDLIHTSYPVVLFGKNIGVPTTFHSVRDMSKDWDVPNPFFKAGRRSDKAQPITIPETKASEKKPSTRKQLSPEVSSKLTDDGKGNFVFHHYSNQKRDVIKPGTGENIITGKEEGGALSAVGGLAMYYTMDNQVEPGVGNVQHTVFVPNDKVYDFNKDPEGFYDEAKKRFEAARPSQSFGNPNYQLAFITQVANENGYDMVVAKWRNNELRAQTTMPLEPAKENVPMQPVAEETYKVGDDVEVYGSKGKVVSIDGDTITYKGEGVSGDINFKRFPKNISKQITPRKQVVEDAAAIEESMEPRKQLGIGYRSGDLINKAEQKGKFEAGNRSTGHFGTGFYFFGTKKQADEYDNRETSSIDLNGYNLAKGTMELHGLLKDVNNYSVRNNDRLSSGIKNIIEYFNKVNGLKNISISRDATQKEFEDYIKEENEQNKKIKLLIDKINSSTIDSPSTIVMKSLGFEGVDSRGTDMDNSQYGSVVYSAKPSIRKQKPNTINDIVRITRAKGFSDAAIREYLKQQGYTDKQATAAINEYNIKSEGIFVAKDGGIPTKITNSIRSFRRRMFSARSFLAKSIFAEKENKDAFIAMHLNIVDQVVKDFNRLYKNYKGDKDALVNDFDAYIRGDKDIELPEGFTEVANSMRNQIDGLSNQLISSGLVDVYMAKTIKDNLGQYLTRSYEIFDNKNWKGKVEAEVRQKAINFLRGQYRTMAEEMAIKENMPVEDALDNLVNNKLDEMLTKDSASNFVSGAKLGEKDLSVLKMREDIPVEIRMLMGEYSDPGLNYAKTILKLSSLAANHKFLSEIKQKGMGVYFFEKNDPRRPIQFNTEIAKKGSETMNPLDGLYTTKEMADAFMSENTQLSNFWKYVMKVQSAVRYSKTILSGATHAKNVIGNLGFVWINGHVDPKELLQSYSIIRNDLKKRNVQQKRDKMNEYIRLGIVKQSAGFGEIMDMFKAADWDTAMASRLSNKKLNLLQKSKKFLLQGKKKVEDYYQAEDDFFKIVAYENELSRYSEALFKKPKDELTDDELKQVNDVVVEIVKNTYPTYDRIPEAIKMIRRAPLIGNFVSFQAESYRTAFNTIALAKTEISSKNPKIKAIGAKRIVGATTYLSVKSAIISYYSMSAGAGLTGLIGYLFDDDDEEKKDKDVRKFVAPWSKMADLVMLDAKPGMLKYIDFSASDPHGGMKKVMNAFFQGDNLLDSFKSAMLETVNPFIGEDMVVEAALSLKNNQDKYGNPIYNTEESFSDQLTKVSSYVYKLIEPGTASSIRRGLSAENKLQELTANITGYRIYDVDVNKQFGYSMKDYSNRIADAKKIYNSVYYDEKATEEEKTKAYNKADKAVKELYLEVSELYNSSERLGAKPEDLKTTMKDFGNMSGQTITEIQSGKIEPLKKKDEEESGKGSGRAGARSSGRAGARSSSRGR